MCSLYVVSTSGGLYFFFLYLGNWTILLNTLCDMLKEAKHILLDPLTVDCLSVS